jgi:folate-binding protein YgfZ
MNAQATFCPIDDHALLLVTGPDARKFLQGQVTCDIDSLKIQQDGNTTRLNSALGAHCTHKGRMVFNFRALPIGKQTVALQVPADMIDIASAALQKYIVFSKADIQNASEAYQLFGMYSDDIQRDLTLFTRLDLPLDEPNTAIHNNDGILLCVEKQRFELWLNPEQSARFKTAYSDRTLKTSNDWHLSTINAGLAEIRPKTSGLFTPHAVNFHNIDTAVSFQKGCYTGQEVVARMHYLGKLKRQLFLFESPIVSINGRPLPQVGDSVYSPEKNQSVGDIVSIGQAEETLRLLVSATVEFAEKNAVFLDEKHHYPLSLVNNENKSTATTTS